MVGLPKHHKHPKPEHLQVPLKINMRGGERQDGVREAQKARY